MVFSIFEMCVLPSLVLYFLVILFSLFLSSLGQVPVSSISYYSHFVGLGTGKGHQWLVWAFLLSFYVNS